MKMTLKSAMAVALLSLTVNVKDAKAGIPVIDLSSLAQHIMSVMQQIQQTLYMIQSYQTQLQQFEYEIKNSLNPQNFLWGDANFVINNLMTQIDSIRGFKQQFGSMNNYLSQYKTVDYYGSTKCLGLGSCNDDQLQSYVSDVNEGNEKKSLTVKQTNDAVIKGLDKQQELIAEDAVKLKDLQRNAQSSKGQLEAIQSANQLASAQAEQLMQIRMLLVAQQAATTTQSQSVEDTSAQQKAAAKKLRESRHVPSTSRGWIL